MMLPTPCFLSSSSWTPLLVLSLLSISAVVVVHSAKNDTTGASSFEFDAENQSIPFPGTAWLTRMASSSSSSMNYTVDGVTYTSAYDALLYGKPLERPCRNFNAYINSFLFGNDFVMWLVETMGSIEIVHYVLCYLRNFVGAMLVYYGTAMMFHYHIYIHPRSKEIFAKRDRPTASIMWDQIKLAQSSLFLYTALPVVDEFLIEQDYTPLVYYTMQEIGGPLWYAVTMLLYFAFVELGVYWMHRTLHTNKFLYKHVHMIHHKYNKADTLTPWASIAFHPLDGILQASPYVVCLFFLPCHYLTHVSLLFFTAIWATYIHDAMDWNVWHVMGSKYHTVHHTHYIYNYGQVFTFCDRIFGTFQEPEGPTGWKKTKKKDV